MRTKPVQLRRTCLVVELMGVSLRAEGHKIRESGFRLEAIMSCMNAAQFTLLERFHDVNDTR